MIAQGEPVCIIKNIFDVLSESVYKPKPPKQIMVRKKIVRGAYIRL